MLYWSILTTNHILVKQFLLGVMPLATHYAQNYRLAPCIGATLVYSTLNHSTCHN